MFQTLKIRRVASLLVAVFLFTGCLPPQVANVEVAVAYVPEDKGGLGTLDERLTRHPFEIGTIVDHRPGKHEEIGAWVGSEGAQSIQTSPHLLHHWIRIGMTRELAESGVLFQPKAHHRLDIDIKSVRVTKQTSVSAEITLAVHLARDDRTIVTTQLKGEATEVKPSQYPEDTVNAALSAALLDALSKLVTSDDFVRRLPG